MSFAGKVGVVTGGCAGIGFAIVKMFLEHGMENIAILHHRKDTTDVSNLLQNDYKNRNILFVRADVAEKDQVKRAFEEIIQNFGSIDYVVSNAGIVDETDYQRTINVNLFGCLHTNYTAIDVMSKENGGRGGVILNVASTVAFDLYSFVPSYSASKHGIIGFHKCLSDDFYFNKHGITFVALCPGLTDTAMIVGIEKRITYGSVEGIELQSASYVGQCVSKILETPKNGAIWIIDGNKMWERTVAADVTHSTESASQ